MIPIYDDNPTERFPLMTVLLILANVAVFGFELTMPTRRTLEAFIASFAMIPAQVATAVAPTEYSTLITSMFLHGGIAHLLGNMIYLWIFGNNVEDAMGRIPFLLFYLVCGIASAAAHLFAFAHSTVPVLGASGAISGVLGAYILLFPRSRVLTLVPFFFFWDVISIPAVFFLGFWFVLQIASGWATSGHGGAGVAWWAHVGGFLAGILLVPFFKRRDVPFLAARRGSVRSRRR